MTRGREPTRVYDPEHDALWAAIRLLRWSVAVLAVAVVIVAVAGLL